MSDSKAHIAHLFNRYFEKSATPAETEELFSLLNISADDEHLTLLLKQAWENLQADPPLFTSAQSEKILSDILLHGADDDTEPEIEVAPVIRMPVWRKYAAVAAVLLLAGAGLYFALKPQPVKITARVKQHDVLPGGNKAILTLANGKTIVLDNAQNGELARQGSSVVNKTQNGQLVYNASTQSDIGNPTSDIQYNTVATPRGGQYQVVLPDGSKVWLNAESSLKYPTVFNGKDRVVEMTGEVYFEVAKNAAKPFRVKSKRAEIEVLGTHFNIMAYDDEAEMKTTLLEGSVKVTAGNTSQVLRPLQQALVNQNNKIVVTSDIDVEEEIAWKNGLFQFNNDDIQAIMRQAARWYDVEVIYVGKVPQKLYSGRISRSVKASQLMEMLKYTGVNSRIEGKNIFIVN